MSKEAGSGEKLKKTTYWRTS